ncbi:ComEA family DNA-binding protein [Pelotalea chapellei]|uniref:Helix-hairpin-helix domain-containing protein n=1 Tax=Pelotalea chapellei TaxID=44671 RepID=A0ABS5UBW5_9BACT|nr:helix-hairpin-helix domain-containing protein [Pelotalea chapellei]MBT1073135.1 helix-hairpin-helix domain-containing protein [Pelotalea chapellei]
MKKSFVRSALAAVALIMSASLAMAVDTTTKMPDVKGAAKATADSAKTGAKSTADTAKGSAKGAAADAKATATDTKDKAKAAATAKVVDINTATAAELKAVPGIGDTYASKIVAGRPYANKAQLKSRNILPAPVYEKVKDLIVAKKK